MDQAAGPITVWLGQIRGGDSNPLDQLIPLLYRELRQIAQSHLSRERRSPTLGATELVNEAYLRLAKQERLSVENRVQFFSLAGEVMRRVLVDYARARRAVKRGGGENPIPLDDAMEVMNEEEADEILVLDDAITRLAAINDRAAEIVRHRFFAGLSSEETSELMGVSTKTVQRDWLTARAWLRKEVRRELDP